MDDLDDENTKQMERRWFVVIRFIHRDPNHPAPELDDLDHDG